VIREQVRVCPKERLNKVFGCADGLA
jgi:hypothetical protein